MNISKWALSNSKLIYYFVATLILGGVFSYVNMSKLEDPAITVKQAMVITTYPGGSPHEVELQVSDKLERAIYMMKGIDKIDSRSSADLSILTVDLVTTVPDNEVEQYWDILRRKVADIQGELPEGASSSVVMDSFGDVLGMFFALSADGYTNEELTDYAELIKSEVQQIEGVSKIELFGVLNPTINISINEDRLANLGITPAEVLQAISGQNKTLYSGYHLTGDQRIRVSVNDKYRTVKDIEELIIRGHQGDQIRLKEIATVERGYSEPTRKAMYYDLNPAIGISISALAGTDVTKLGDEVTDLIDRFMEERIPVGVECQKVFFQPERVAEAINLFLINLIESIIIVVVVLMFAMGIRSGVLLGVTLVVTVLGSVLFLYMFEGTLQRVSLATFVLAMGMLVDNAIVIVDGIIIDMKSGRLRSRYLSEIGRKTAMPLLGATIIAILAFLPLFLSPDTAGVYVRDLFVVLAVSLLLSWVLSLTMVPLLAKVMLKVPAKGEAKQKKSISKRVLSATLGWALRNRTIAIVASLILVAVSGVIYKGLPQSFFPDLTYNQVYIEYKLPESSDSSHTERDLKEISSYLLSRGDVSHVTASVGNTPSRYNLVRSIATPAISYGDLIVDFDCSEESLLEAIPQIQSYLTDNYPQAYVRVKRYNLMYNKYPLEVTFSGADPDVLRELTSQAQQIMDECGDIYLVTSDWERKVPMLEVEYNQATAREMSLSRQDVALSLLASTDGIPAGVVFNGRDRETIMMKCVDQNGERIEDLTTAPIFPMIPSIGGVNKESLQGLMTGAISEEELISGLLSTTPLGQVADRVTLHWEDPVIIRSRGQRAMRAQANNIPSVGAENARAQIVEQVEAIELPSGYTMRWQGEVETKTKSMKYLLMNLPLAIILMIGILIMLFKDYKKPAIILLCVPLLFVGAVFGVWISGKAFGFVAICGVLGLIGMMIKNGVVLMDEINLEIKSGRDPYDALIVSSESRLQPVMMASLTTILGMIPLLPDAMFGPLAATIMGGLFVGTIVTLIFIPVLYSLLFNIKR